MRPQPPEGEDGQGHGVVAGEDAEAARQGVDEFGDLRDVAAGFLDADDVLFLCEAEDGLGFEVRAGARGDVVEQDGQMDCLRDGPEVLVLAFLAGRL